MSSVGKTRAGRLGALVLGALGALPAVAQDAADAFRAAPLRVCALDDNLPYASRAGGASGFDLEVAAAVARHTGQRVVPVWTGRAEDIQEIEGDLPLARLARGDCDALFSVPGPATETLGARDTLALGAPYYGAAFELVGCGAELPPSVAGLAGRAVAIQSQTVAHFALLAAGAEPRNYFSINAAFAAVRDGETTAALLWGPAIGWRLRMAAASGLTVRDPRYAACAPVAGYTPPAALSWNLHVATRREPARVRERIDDALATLASSGELERIARTWGVPWHAPFAATYTRQAIEELRGGAH
ncbi:MAG: transporter substrate-binding domain-containing protein [Gammaproteobacteria bacterium]